MPRSPLFASFVHPRPVIEIPLPYHRDGQYYCDRLDPLPGFVWLDSGTLGGEHARYDIFSALPSHTVSGTASAEQINQRLLTAPAQRSDLPFCGGWIGYFGYQARHRQFGLVSRSDYTCPDQWFGWYDCALIQDHLQKKARLVVTETCPANTRQQLEAAIAGITLKSDAAIAEKRAAVELVASRGGQNAINILTPLLATAPAELQPDLQAAIDRLSATQAAWNVGQNVWYGVSLGSVLLLAAIGLAITFGVMGVINMAHGEMVMIGAYTTFVVQEIIRQSFPGLFDWSLLIALPLAFLMAAAIGVAIERGVIRWLYGRPLETLLATWGISLILQQSVRSIFGATNREVGNPSWMSGAFELGGMTITWNRFWIVFFAIGVFLALLAVLNRTPLGLQMRAVTQNRRMASSMGIRTPFVDAMTFGLGSGIAGLAGVALSQIDNVSPNLGQNYIIDSFMVVVFGGVGNLWGTLLGALTIGIANKFLEPYAGAVLAKILILVLIILFIQRRPRGLFALKGRAVEQ